MGKASKGKNRVIKDFDKFISEIEDIQQKSIQLNIDLRKDQSIISDSVAAELLDLAKIFFYGSSWRRLPTVLHDDCISTALLYFTKYAIKSFNAKRGHGRILPYFQRIANSAFQRVHQNFKTREQKKEAYQNLINEQTWRL